MAKSLGRQVKSDDADTTGSPVEAFARSINIIEQALKIVGINALREGNFTIERNTVITFLAVLIYYGFTISTMVQMYSVNKHYLVEVTSTLGSAVQGCNKLFMAIWFRPKLYDIRRHLESIYDEYSNQGPHYRRAMNRNCSNVHRVIILLFVTYGIAAAGLVCSPLPSLILRGKRNLILHFYIPGLDISTEIGYFVTMGLHSLCVLIGTFGLYTGDSIVLMYLMQSFTFTDIFRLKIKALNEIIDDEENYTNNNNNRKKNTMHMLINIVKWHQLYTDFMARCNDVFFWPVSITITTTAFSIVVTIYVSLSTDWSGALPYLISLLCVLYIYCIMGTKIENCNDCFCYEMYNISWYKLDAKQQRILLTMLVKSQKPNRIDVLGVIPLSVSTGLSITKTVYRITMMMMQFLNE